MLYTTSSSRHDVAGSTLVEDCPATLPAGEYLHTTSRVTEVPVEAQIAEPQPTEVDETHTI